jgi:hypothetical protein
MVDFVVNRSIGLMKTGIVVSQVLFLIVGVGVNTIQWAVRNGRRTGTVGTVGGSEKMLFPV